MITSLQNKRIKETVKLRRRKGRDAQHRFLIDGLREIQQALTAHVECLEAYVCPPRLDDEGRALLHRLAAITELLDVTPQVWEKLTFGNRHEGIVVVARRQPQPLSSLATAGPEPVLVLDRIEKPGNVGAVFRSAAAAGVSAIVMSDPGTDLFNPNTIRASLGTVFRIPAYQATASASIAWLLERNMPTFVAHLDGKLTYYEAPLAESCAIVLGSEAEGATQAWCRDPFTRIRIPMQPGMVDSLNVASSGAILLYEALRQRSMS